MQAAAGAAKLAPDVRAALDEARVKRDKELSGLGLKYRKQIDEIHSEWAEKRRDVYRRFDVRRDALLKDVPAKAAPAMAASVKSKQAA